MHVYIKINQLLYESDINKIIIFVQTKIFLVDVCQVQILDFISFIQWNLMIWKLLRTIHLH